MKTRISHLISILLTALTFMFLSSTGRAGDAPTYRGKVVLVVDKTMASDPDVSWRIERLVNDLTGDGWRVLRHDVDRGPDLPYNWPTEAQVEIWAPINAPRVREIRALIKADYDASPTEVKCVFLLGHVPVPYSGANNAASNIVGGHYTGAIPSDTFYGDMTSLYGPGGWSDEQTDLEALQGDSLIPQVLNRPDDGKFDQNYVPSPMKLGVGRVDLSRMPVFGVNEATLVSRYLDKDHDFRCANFNVQRRYINVEQVSVVSEPVMEQVFGANNVTYIAGEASWFPYVSASGQDYLQGFAFGSGFNANGAVGSAFNFAEGDSRVVFVNFFNSFSGNWEEQNDLLRSVIGGPYDPANGRFSYGLAASFGGLGRDGATLTNRMLGATIGEAIFNGFTSVTGYGLMGDPTLRMHSVLPPSSLTAGINANTVGLSWVASGDSAVVGYNVYSAPTRRGPYTLVNTSGFITGTSYSAQRPWTGNPPDNFYMIRTVKAESTSIGSYTNMSEGVIISLPGALTPYLNIQNQPASQKATAQPLSGGINSCVFTVDAVGSDVAGNQQLTYQWYKGSTALVDNGHTVGGNTAALLIRNVQAADAGEYYVIVSNSKLYDVQSDTDVASITSSTASLTFSAPPTAVADTYDPITRDTTHDFDVLANDTDPDNLNSELTIMSVSALSDPSAGTLTLNPDNRTLHFVPARTFIGQLTATYAMSDGSAPSQALITINVVPTPGNLPPVVSTIGTQEMTEDTTIDVPFTVTDDLTTAENMKYAVTCSAPALIPASNFTVTGTGANRILHIKAGTHEIGSGFVTMTVTDEDLATTSLNFTVTIDSVTIPTLLASSDGMQPDGFHISINGPANSTFTLMMSDDLVKWTSLGTFAFSGNIYSFVDSTVGSATHRFYAAANQNGCSLNKVGFINETFPIRKYLAVANQLNNPIDNTVNSLFVGLENGAEVIKWDVINGVETRLIKGRIFTDWITLGTTLNPGEGGLVLSPSAETITFVGDLPQGIQVNSGFPTSVGGFALMSSIIPRAGSLDDLGFPAQAGDTVQQWDVSGQSWSTTATYNGAQWSPAVPTVQIGEAFFLQSGSSSSRSWTESLPECIPTVALTSPVDGQAFRVPTSIVLSATASAGAGIAQVEFFQGSTSLGLGTLSGGSYVLTWNNPDSGDYAITAHATDNDGITTISLPANIIVQNTLSSEGMSGGNFQFTINGKSGASVEVKASDDLATWTSLGNVTLTSGTYVFADTSTSSFAHRFYHVEESGVCSANTVGFVSMALPSGVFVSFANPLNNPAGNVVSTIFGGFPNGTLIEKWNMSSQSYQAASKAFGNWNAPTMSLNPGDGALVKSPSVLTITFVGEVPSGTQVNGSFPTIVGQYSMLGSIIPRAGTLDAMDFPIQSGDAILQWDVPTQQWVTTATYNGTAWNPAVPTIPVAGAFFIQSGTTSARGWTETFSPCP